ncbi:MAG: peptidoglycan-binding protein [Actinobacteria bacterium]|nr:peptidoglycan-binding protein [Actinomycetota bacterium]
MKPLYDELHAWPTPRDPAVELPLAILRRTWRLFREVMRLLDRAGTSVVPRSTQRRVAFSLVPLAVAVSALGFVAIGVRVGGTGPAPTLQSQLVASDRLRVADVLPPQTAKRTVAEPPTTVAPRAVAPAAPTLRGALPVGKGMWIYLPKAVEGGNPQAIVARAKAVGLTHLYVRTGSSKAGFYGADFLTQLLPVAHAAGIRVYGWDFPYLDNVAEDVSRAVAAITFTTPSGDTIDGFSADIEFPSIGVKVTPENATAYGAGLRQAVGAQYPLIATVPRPSHKIKFYPYTEVVASFDAIAPMVYWLNRDPVSDVAGAMADLAKFNKPVFPIGQAYDGAADHGPPGVPGRAALLAFMEAAERTGANSVSFWSWQHASQEAWDAIRDATQFTLPAAPAGVFTPPQVRAYQSLLTSLGFPTAVDGVWGKSMIDAVSAYQRAGRLPVTGVIDTATKGLLLKPFKTPLLGR